MKNLRYLRFILLMLLSMPLFSQTVPTMTVPGNLKVNDSLHVVNNISTAGDVKATGEIISKDTMRAEKDVIVDGNAVIRNNLVVAGASDVLSLIHI